MLAFALCKTGEISRGIEILEELVHIVRTGRIVPSEVAFMSFLMYGYVFAGDYNNTKQTGKELLELAERCGAKYQLGWAHLYLGEAALETDPSQAASHLEQSTAIFRECKAENHLALAYSGLGRFHKQQGNTAQARHYLTQGLEIFKKLGTLIEPDKVRKELADLKQC